MFVYINTSSGPVCGRDEKSYDVEGAGIDNFFTKSSDYIQLCYRHSTLKFENKQGIKFQYIKYMVLSSSARIR